MKWEEIFVANHRVRSGCRFLIAMILVFSAQVAVGTLLGILFWEPGREQALFWANCLTLPALLAVFKMLTALFEGRPLGSIGLAFHGRWSIELGIGLALGAAMVLAVTVMELGLGAARFSWNPISAEQVAWGGAFYGVLLAVAATNEELIFRGYPLQRLVETVGPVGAVGISSALFGLAHLGNPARTWLSTLNTALVGVPLGVAYLRTRALWLPIGIHFAWNLSQGYIFGFPVSGMGLSGTLLIANEHGLAWMTGGDYGPEGGILATGVIVIGTVYLLFSRRIYISGEMQELALGTSASSPSAPRDPISIFDSGRVNTRHD